MSRKRTECAWWWCEGSWETGELENETAGGIEIRKGGVSEWVSGWVSGRVVYISHARNIHNTLPVIGTLLMPDSCPTYALLVPNEFEAFRGGRGRPDKISLSTHTPFAWARGLVLTGGRVCAPSRCRKLFASLCIGLCTIGFSSFVYSTRMQYRYHTLPYQ